MALLQEHGKDYNKIAESLESKTATQIRYKCCGLKRGEGAGGFDIDESVMQMANDDDASSMAGGSVMRMANDDDDESVM